MKTKTKFALLVLYVMLLPFLAQANVIQQARTDANIYGHVIDKQNGEHLPYISIFVKGTMIGTTTDASGHYFLKNLPIGTLSIEVKSIGYRTVQKEIEVKANSTHELNFELEHDDVALDEVVVSANRNETQRKLAPNLVNVIKLKIIRDHAVRLPCPRVELPTGSQDGGQLSKLRFHPSAHQWIGRPLFANINKLPTCVFGIERGLWT